MNIKEKLENMQYRFLGEKGAIEICHWTKKAILNEGSCYKQKFYGIPAHMCAQISPIALWCSNNCIYCWRPMEFMKLKHFTKEEVDNPQTIIEEAVKKRRELLIGFKGNKYACKEKVKEILEEFPDHWAISLSGEPLLYPYLLELITLLKSKKEVRSVFIVSNGQEIEMMERMLKENSLPIQFYLSITGSNKEQYRKIHRPIYKDGWERILKALEIMRVMPTRRVIRITLIKGINDKEEDIRGFKELIERGLPDFVEIKGYMYLGYSMKRLKRENMPSHKEIKDFSEKLLEILPNYHYEDEQEESRIVLLKYNKSKYPNIILFHDEENVREILMNDPNLNNINAETSINKIIRRYRKIIPILREKGIDTLKNTCLSIGEIEKRKNMEKNKLVEEIKKLIKENYKV